MVKVTGNTNFFISLNIKKLRGTIFYIYPLKIKEYRKQVLPVTCYPKFEERMMNNDRKTVFKTGIQTE